MNKKQLIELMESMVARVAKDQQVSEDEARVLVGLAVKKNAEKIFAGIVLPTFDEHPATAAAELLRAG